MEGKLEDDEDDQLSSQLLPNGWQQIHSPHQPHPRDWEMVDTTPTTATTNYDDLSIFPPSDHEGLHIPQPLADVALHDVDADPFHARVAREEVRPLREQLDYRPGSVGGTAAEKLKLGLGIVRAKIGSLLVRWGDARGRVKFSFGQVAGVTVVWVVALWYLKWQRWRRAAKEEKIDGLVLLVRQQDEKISRLVDQISRLNELLTYRRGRGVSILHTAY